MSASVGRNGQQIVRRNSQAGKPSPKQPLNVRRNCLDRNFRKEESRGEEQFRHTLDQQGTFQTQQEFFRLDTGAVPDETVIAANDPMTWYHDRQRIRAVCTANTSVST